MDSEYRLCPACRAPNTVQDPVCAACGAALPKVVMGPPPAFDEVPSREEARQAARTGIGRGLVAGVAGAAILGLLLAKTFRSSALQVDPAQTTSSAQAVPEPETTPQPVGINPGPAVPAPPPGWVQPNPYASTAAGQPGIAQPGLNPAGVVPPGVNPAGAMPPGSAMAGSPVSGVGAAPVSGPASSAAAMPAVMIAARPRPSPTPDARGGGKAASYTDADLARMRSEADAEASGTAPSATPPPSPAAGAAAPASSPRPAPTADPGGRSRGALVSAAQQRVAKAQSVVDEIRREARDNDDDGLQEELEDALHELKSAQRDLARAIRQQEKSERDGRSLPPPQ